MPVNRPASAAAEVAMCFGNYLLVNQLVAGAVSAPGWLGPFAVRRHHRSTESNTPYTDFGLVSAVDFYIFAIYCACKS
ncbi:hypothetical protein EJB05_18268 [Eragrostis curvula]|uniref:Uncharacterized protein n=1 Tax=Eragrostis curvula TaxID=38414 RepID=A0A5J9VLK1_9POAL|nr:hypothetical protein EJB05_18268 [Eragrostis curvula]